MNDPNPGPLYVAEFGTSMSTPMVTGACAMLFQCKGASATWADLVSILKANAVPESPVNAFGAGYMELAAVCSPPMQNVDVWLRDDVTDTGVEPFTGPVNWLSPDIGVLDANGGRWQSPSTTRTQRSTTSSA